MRFHLLGGVTPEEAERVEAVHGQRWTVCQPGCSSLPVAVLLMRGESGQPGDVQGRPACEAHEAELLELIRSSRGYKGTSVTRR